MLRAYACVDYQRYMTVIDVYMDVTNVYTTQLCYENFVWSS